MKKNERQDAELARLRLRVEELERENVALRGERNGQGSANTILSMCASCKRMRDGAQRWVPLETVFSTRFHIDLSHSLCPVCAPELGFHDV